MIERAFTTRIPLAVMIVTGLKKCENRSCLPIPRKGLCGISCSRNSNLREYEMFLNWVRKIAGEVMVEALPKWSDVESWRGKMIATCEYVANENPGAQIWDEGYRYWWHISNVRMLEVPFPVRGYVGMWNID